MKIISWNVNGVRAWYKKGSLDWVLEQKPDIFCFQEMKAEEPQLPDGLRSIPGYKLFMDHSKHKKGYSGVAIYVKEQYQPIKVDTELIVNNPSILKSVAKSKRPVDATSLGEFDHEGRFIALHFQNFVLINCYFPNGGGDGTRLTYKMNFYASFFEYIKKMRDTGKKVIFCGDVNVAHTEIDIARPKENEHRPGFLPQERAWIDSVIENGFQDVFRHRNPGAKDVYTWWDLKSFARDRNIGWRIDYFFVDTATAELVKDTAIHTNVYGSDHCPLSIDIKL